MSWIYFLPAPSSRHETRALSLPHLSTTHQEPKLRTLNNYTLLSKAKSQSQQDQLISPHSLIIFILPEIPPSGKIWAQLPLTRGESARHPCSLERRRPRASVGLINSELINNVVCLFWFEMNAVASQAPDQPSALTAALDSNAQGKITLI
ncbi:unnamed protein product [Leuciscus chuanchicus]